MLLLLMILILGCHATTDNGRWWLCDCSNNVQSKGHSIMIDMKDHQAVTMRGNKDQVHKVYLALEGHVA